MPDTFTADQVRIIQLEKELAETQATIARIDGAIAALQEQAKADPEFAKDAEYADRLNDEGGRRRNMDNRRQEIEQDLAKLKTRRG